MYERFFGLSDLPFRLTPDPRYLFLSSRHADALAHLKLGLTESSGFVCITGDVGTGKTTLLRHFLAGLASDVHTAYVFNPALTALELLQTINAEFRLPATSDSKTALISALNAHLLAEHAAGRRSVVVVDEAQALDLAVLEQLRLLSNLETTTEKLLRIVLVGQPQLRDLLQHPDLTQLNQRITLRWHIGPLTAAETAAYVRHRVAVAAGTSGRQLFTRRALGRIHRLSGGVPRLINMIAHRALIAAFAAERPRVGSRTVALVHRELSAVPLPKQRRSGWPVRIAASLAALCLAVAIGFVARERIGRAPAITTPMAPPPVVPTPPTIPPAPPADAMLAALDAGDGQRFAFAAIARAWATDPPAADVAVAPNAYGELAAERGLQHATLEANTSMLRLLDVPAILELHFPGGVGLRPAALVGAADGGSWQLDVAGERVDVDDAFLDRHWFGHAHVFWRDDARLGRTPIVRWSSGARVERLQRALADAGAFDGPASGTFDDATEDAVRGFQRAHFLEPDGLVGPLTKLALTTATTDRRPSLAIRKDDPRA